MAQISYLFGTRLEEEEILGFLFVIVKLSLKDKFFFFLDGF